MSNFATKVLNNFVGGEISPRMYARVGLETYDKSVAKCLNFITLIQGGARYRNGFSLVHQTKQNKKAWLIPFQFSDQQSYLIEATDLVFRFYSNGGVLFGNGLPIQRITNSRPAIVTSAAHGLTAGTHIIITEVNGIAGINGTTYQVANPVTTNTFALDDLSGNPIDTRRSGTYASGGLINVVTGAITGITQANPAVVTAAAHGLANGQEIQLNGVVGMTQVNGQFFLVAGATTNTFQLTDLQGNNINSTAYGAYVSGGSISTIYEVTTPYAEADIPTLQFCQNANTMYITHQNYEPRKLTRNSAANFTLATFARTGTNPFPSGTQAKYPRCANFVNGTRLLYGDTTLNPETLWASSAPSTGNTAFDDFTLASGSGGTTVATDSIIFTLAPLLGKADSVQWITNTNQFGVVGCFGSVRSLYGGTTTEPISPVGGISSTPINSFGCAQVMPVSTGESMFYVERGNQILRTLTYDFTVNGYNTIDLTLVAEHLTITGMQQIVYQNSVPDCIWSVLGNGRFIGLTYKLKENIQGWHQHYMGGQSINSNGLTNNFGLVLSLGIMPRAVQPDQLWATVERVINGQTIRSVEYMDDVPGYPNRSDFYSGEANQTVDQTLFNNSMYETQKYANHLDMSNLYDGSEQAPGITLTPSATTGNPINVTASAAFFTNAMIGHQLWKQYDLNGNGGGRCIILSITSPTVAVCQVTSNFDNTNTWNAGNWLITTNTVSGLNYANGATVNVIADGGNHVDCVVANGAITLDGQHSVVWVGFKYQGILESLNLDVGGQSGSAMAKMRSVREASLWFFNSVSAYIGTKYYNLKKMNLHQHSKNILGRPTQPVSGQTRVTMYDSWDDNLKRFIVSQIDPMPCTVLSSTLEMATVDEGD